ncbi:MAG: LysR family glycine cleavage system transcriptional activator [Granulosicoccus sp.]|jgi:LysR family glycine cleavage system transcriptional activator
MPDQSRLPPLKALRVLEALHETGTVMGAARKLNVSHSAISHQIKILENWTTHPLFVRHGRTTMLSAAGKSLAGVAHEAFDSIRHEMDRLPLRGLRSITLASLPLVASEWLMPHLHRFSEIHPETNLHISLSQTDHPISPMPDIEIRFAQQSKLLPNDIVLFLGAAVPVCSQVLLDKFDADTERLLSKGPLVYDEDLRMWSLWLERAGLDRSADAIKSGMLVEGSAMLRSAARASCGVALCRTAFLKTDLQESLLVQISDITIDEDWCYFMRCSDSSRSVPGVSELLAYLKSCAE